MVPYKYTGSQLSSSQLDLASERLRCEGELELTRTSLDDLC